MSFYDLPPCGESAPELRCQLNRVTRMLCALCTEVEDEHNFELISPELSGWWEAHKKDDAARGVVR